MLSGLWQLTRRRLDDEEDALRKRSVKIIARPSWSGDGWSCVRTRIS